ncbi:MAG: choice-of-anchor Q domain-containing protein [Solirubrobacterales bacterium]
MNGAGTEYRPHDRSAVRWRLAATVRAGVLAVSILAIAPSLASAAIRYTSPTGSGTACSEASPCSFVQGVTAASDGDTVQLRAEEYSLAGQRVDVSANNLTIQGPGPVGDASTFIPYLMFGDDPGGALGYRLVFFGTNPKLKNLAITGQGTTALVNAPAAQLSVDRVIIDYFDANPPSTGGIALVGDNLTITNSVIRNEGGLSSSKALEASGTITGSLVYASLGTAISLDGAFHSPGRCTLTARNTIAWGGSENLAMDGPGGGPCTSVTFDYDYSWIPLSSGAQTGGGYLPLGSSVLQSGTNNLPELPTAVDPANPGAIIVPASSPAINAGCTAGCGTYDYYGRPRPIGPANDIGPYEATLPATVSNVAVSDVGAWSAKFGATINPNGGATAYNFRIRKQGASEWASFSGGTTGGGTSPEALSGSLFPPDLEAETTYEVRLEGVNSTAVNATSPSITTFRTLREPEVRILSTRTRLSRKGGSMAVKVRVSTPGTIALTGRYATGSPRLICRGSKVAASAGNLTLNCRFNRKVRSGLRKRALKLALGVELTNAAGEGASAQRRVTVRKKR